MKNFIYKIIITFSIICVAIFSTLSTFVSAESSISLNVPTSVDENASFNISLNLPAEAYGAQASIKVEYPDGTNESKKIVYIADMSSNPNSVSFTAKGSGNAKVTATNIKVTKSDASLIECNSSASATIKINGKIVQNNIVNNSASVPANNTVSQTNTVVTPNQTNTTNTNNTVNNTVTPAPEVTFKNVSETVYTTENCKIRKGYSTSSEVVTIVNKNTKLKRIGIGSNNWSKIEYNGQTLYISSTYLTTKEPVVEEVTFKDVNEKMYATKSCNIRKSYSQDSEKAGSLKLNEEVNVIGKGSNGWYKIKYNGETLYVLGSLLSNKKVEVQENIITNEVSNELNNIVNEISSNVIENIVTPDTENVVDENSQKLEVLKEEVGVLPEVGINPARILHMVITLITVIVSAIVIYKNKNEI